MNVGHGVSTWKLASRRESASKTIKQNEHNDSEDDEDYLVHLSGFHNLDEIDASDKYGFGRGGAPRFRLTRG